MNYKPEELLKKLHKGDQLANLIVCYGEEDYYQNNKRTFIIVFVSTHHLLTIVSFRLPVLYPCKSSDTYVNPYSLNF